MFQGQLFAIQPVSHQIAFAVGALADLLTNGHVVQKGRNVSRIYQNENLPLGNLMLPLPNGRKDAIIYCEIL